jgi:hypothetical protein
VAATNALPESASRETKTCGLRLSAQRTYNQRLRPPTGGHRPNSQAPSRGNVGLFRTLGNYASSVRLGGGAEGIQTDGHRDLTPSGRVIRQNLSGGRFGQASLPAAFCAFSRLAQRGVSTARAEDARQTHENSVAAFNVAATAYRRRLRIGTGLCSPRTDESRRPSSPGGSVAVGESIAVRADAPREAAPSVSARLAQTRGFPASTWISFASTGETMWAGSPGWLLMRVLAYRIQAVAFGDLDRAILRRLHEPREEAFESRNARPFASRRPTTREGVGLLKAGHQSVNPLVYGVQ